jgi:hypothetical protein
MIAIKKTGIFDTNYCNPTDTTKILLFEEVINHFLPLFREEIEKKKETLQSHIQDAKKLKTDISKTKQFLVKINESYKREKLKKEILEEISFLYTNEILYGNNKKIVLDLLDVLGNLEFRALDEKVKLLRSMVHKNVKKVKVI